MMFHDFQQQIAETRRVIRFRIHQKRLYDRCLVALKEEQRAFRKAETRLKKVGFGAQSGEFRPLNLLFSKMLGAATPGKLPTRMSLLFAKLNQLAGGQVIEYLSQRVGYMSNEDVSVKALETSERKVKKQFEKFVSGIDDAKAVSLVSYLFKIEDLKADINEARSAFDLGEKARHQLVVLNRNLKDVTVWGGTAEMDELLNSGSDSIEIFSHAVQAHMLLCAFKNELGEFAPGRDLALHFESITGFKDTFFNNLILDWVEEHKIKLSAFFVRKTLNSLEAMLQGLNSKIIKIESELAIMIQECNAILQKAGVPLK